ncbi:hypothetical protein SLH46_21355 [Draconibacterium sp. IB214405]|uniref:hypothetical protein n=1 Tax=Draconibacterium sp. IB214405 TaxID=3097352 RepID=UPI002A17E6EB|nr:hypothetical protein [Draconibacterium sp. IB214405]MDX8341761.1 hypothetical protein [Draconibacterium sp. IB214405]
MKKLHLKNKHFIRLEDAFREWLQILGYSQSIVYNIPNIIREFLYFLENNYILKIVELQRFHYSNYFEYIKKEETSVMVRL